LTQELLPLAHRSEKPGDDVFSPYLQVQGDIKMTYQKTLAHFSSLPSPGITGHSFSLNKPFLSHPIHVFCLVSSTPEHKDQDLLETTFADNKAK
jgi:hypothetical protein